MDPSLQAEAVIGAGRSALIGAMFGAGWRRYFRIGGQVMHPEFRDSELRYRKDGALYRCRHYRAGMRNTVTE
jgi:hypothetical protein